MAHPPLPENGWKEYFPSLQLLRESQGLPLEMSSGKAFPRVARTRGNPVQEKFVLTFGVTLSQLRAPGPALPRLVRPACPRTTISHTHLCTSFRYFFEWFR